MSRIISKKMLFLNNFQFFWGGGKIIIVIVPLAPCPCVGNAERNGVPSHNSTCIQ
jgi:hypothetical protein